MNVGLGPQHLGGPRVEIEVRTTGLIEAVDVTGAVLAHLPGEGATLVSLPHTSAALMLSENDADLLRDVERLASGLLKPFEPFAHARGGVANAQAHLLSSLIGTQLTLISRDGTWQRGPWQHLILVELDGPKDRTISIERLGGSS